MESPSPQPESRLLEKQSILIERKAKRTKNELLISYDTAPIEKLIENEEEKANLLKLIKNILLSCNFSYLKYFKKKMRNYLSSLLFYNIFYFILIKLFFDFLTKKKNKEEKEELEASLYKKLLLFNIPELLLIFFYHRKNFLKNNNSVSALFTYLNERISYIFNQDKNNNYLCKVNQENYNINLIKKNGEVKTEENKLYTNNEEYLSKETFFDSVISYANAEFGDFDYNNLEKNEEDLFQDIFELINNIEKKIKSDNSFIKAIGTFIRNLSFTNSTKYNIPYAFGLKILAFLINETYLNDNVCKTQREKLIEEKTKEFNQKNMANGYFLAINESVILLFKIKDNYKSFDESYSILYTDAQNLLKHYFQ